KGPHIYLHGHMHQHSGSSMSMGSGHNLALFGAGAVYDSDKEYPLRFAFYDVDIGRAEIRPCVYVRDPKGIDVWERDNSLSHPVKAALPVLGIADDDAKAAVSELRELVEQVVRNHVAVSSLLRS